jgi:hypothetical protein
MGLWLWDADPQFSFSLADELTELRVALILRGAWEPDEPCCAEVIDLAAERAARNAH